ncbi:hypothetical protein LINGRAHAP2_LOCUS23805 [Linum grandiflorum]
MHEKIPKPNAWTKRTNTLFEEFRGQDNWYVADSDSEDVAEAMSREEDDEVNEEDDDPLCPQICFTAAEKNSFRRAWRSALVVNGLGRNVPYIPLERRLNAIWARNGQIQISDLKNGCYLVRFRCQEDYEWAINGGPWLLGDTYLTVHRWFKGFDPWRTTIKTTMVWVELPDLPIEFYNPIAVMRIASRIGKPVGVDRATKERARGKYARVCVEVNLTKALLPKYKIEGIPYLIVYEGFHKICTNCGAYGAPTHLCKCQNPLEAPPETEMTSFVHNASNGKVFGDWMMPRRKYRRPTRPVQVSNKMSKLRTHTTVTTSQGNRFDALNLEQNNDISDNTRTHEETETVSEQLPPQDHMTLPYDTTIKQRSPTNDMTTTPHFDIPSAVTDIANGQINSPAENNRNLSPSNSHQHSNRGQRNSSMSQQIGTNSKQKGAGNRSPLGIRRELSATIVVDWGTNVQLNF